MVRLDVLNNPDLELTTVKLDKTFTGATLSPSYTQYPRAGMQPQSNRPPPQYAPAGSVKASEKHTSYVSPPPYYPSSQQLFKTVTGDKKKKTSGRWRNPFSRKDTTTSSSTVVNPRGLQAEMLDPENRAW